MRLPLALALAGVVLAHSPGQAQAPQLPADGPSRLFVLFVDDFHVEFAAAPRMRDLINRTMNVLVRPDDRVAIVTTGYSSVSQGPTPASDSQAMQWAVRRITGSGLPPLDALRASAGADAERRRRMDLALDTFRSVLDRIAGEAGSKVILLLSNGYDVAPGPTSSVGTKIVALSETARRSGITIFAFDVRALVRFEHPQVAGIAPDAWAAHLERLADSLRRLAEPTGGMLVSSPSQFDLAIQTIDAIR